MGMINIRRRISVILIAALAVSAGCGKDDPTNVIKLTTRGANGSMVERAIRVGSPEHRRTCEDLRKENSRIVQASLDLSKQRPAVGDTTAEASQRLDEINKEIEANTSALKANYEEQQTLGCTELLDAGGNK